MDKEELVVSRFMNRLSAPVNPVPGMAYFDSAQQMLKVYNGTAWADAWTIDLGFGRGGFGRGGFGR